MQILRMMQDPLVPRATKRLLRDSIEKHQVAISRLTNAVMNEFSSVGLMEAVTFHKNQSFGRFPATESSPSPNKTNVYAEPTPAPATIISAHKLKSPYTVFIQDRPIDAGGVHNDTFALVHELAHVKFDVFLERNIRRLAKRFSPDLIRKGTHGIFEIRDQFFDYLTERFAHEYPVAGLRATAGRYFPLQNRYGWGRIGPDYRTLLAEAIFWDYSISDPKIRRLAGRPLSQIFLSKKIPDPSIRELVEDLDKDSDVAAEAARYLGERPALPRYAIRALIAAMTEHADSEMANVKNARIALAKHGAPATDSKLRLWWWSLSVPE